MLYNIIVNKSINCFIAQMHSTIAVYDGEIQSNVKFSFKVFAYSRTEHKAKNGEKIVS